MTSLRSEWGAALPYFSSRSRLPDSAVTLVIAVATLGEAALTLTGSHPLSVVFSFLAAVGLVARTRLPWLSVLLTIPGLAFGCASIAAVIALYSLAVRCAPAWLLALVCCASFIANAIGSLGASFEVHPVAVVTTAAMFALAPAAVGVLVATRARLVASLSELESAHAEQRSQATADAIRHEREVLAREMHDVVSHQVSLMAVQAGAMQVSAPDTTSREGARTIRELCVTTLTELRDMLAVLRSGSGGPHETVPQPTLADLEALVGGSELDVTLNNDLPASLGLGVQRAVFRTVQESLTNARKHAPGSPVTVCCRVDGDTIEVRVSNRPAHQPPLALPGSGLGLVGLRERAQVLGGVVRSAATADGGYETVMRVPLH